MLKRIIIIGIIIAGAVIVLTQFWDGAQRLKPSTVAVQPLAAADAPSQQIIPQSDEPPAGTRSLFDHLLAENDGLPYPFAKLNQLLSNYDARQRAAHSVLIPDGRSLLKAQANFFQPRIVTASNAMPAAATDFALAPILKGRVFLGFVEAANEIEVISYNERAGRFEYQLVKDYCQGCTPRIVYAKRALCLTCHSNQAAIFSVRPWAETNAQLAISADIASARDQAPNADYHGVPLASNLDEAEAVDNMTEIANTLTTTQRLWLDSCGVGEAGQQCRTSLLKLAIEFGLNPGGFAADSPAVKTLLTQQAKQWPAAGVTLPSGDLASRDPFSAHAHGGGIRGFINSLFGRNVTDEESGENTLAAFEKLPPLPKELDPLLPRPPKAVYQADTLEGVYGVAQFFATTDWQMLEQLSKGDLTTLQTAVDAPVVQAELTLKPLQRASIINALRVALGQSALQSCCDNVDDLSPPVIDGEPPLQLAEDSPLQPFAEYCFACHRGNPSKRLNFMSGKTEQIVLEKIQNNDKIRDALDYERYQNTAKAGQLMPPPQSWQRTQFDQARANGQAPHEKMREVVPDLFGF